MTLASLLSFAKKRAIELSGICLLAIGIGSIAAFLSYNPADPSLNHATRNQVTNITGTAGAFFAGPLLQLFGLAVISFVIVPLCWSWRIIHERYLPLWWLRIAFFAFFIGSLAATLSLLDSWFTVPEIWPSDSFGGVIGAFVRDDLTPLIGPVGFAVILPTIVVVTLYFSTGLTPHEWSTLFYFLANAVATLWNTGVIVIEKLQSIRITRNTTPHSGKTKKGTAAKRKRRTIEISRRKPTKSSKKAVQTTLDLKTPDNIELPPLSLLRNVPLRNKKNVLSESALSHNASLLEKVLDDFGVNGKITKVRPGPVVTLYELEPSPGTKSSRVISLSDDIARSMSAISARISTIPGRNVIGIELPNSERETVYLRDLLETEEYTENRHELALTLGKTIDGEPFIMDLAKMPHLLIAGTTGSGKSVGINAMILSLLYQYTPDQCKLIMIDPKMLELSVYEGIPHLLTPVVTEPGKAVVALKWAVKEMESRYRLMSNLGVRNIAGYNKAILEAKSKGEELTRTVQTGFDPSTGQPIYEKQPIAMTPLPFIVVIVDEMADLMIVSGKEIEASIQRLAQMARAAGIHLIMATQRPSVDVITGVIKANFPTRISFQVTSRIDSRTILGEQGAEQLLGQGDMLYMAGGSRITRVHGPFVDDKEVEKVVSYLKKQAEPEYILEVTEADDDDLTDFSSGDGEKIDELYDKAVAIVIQDGRASTSYVQRALRIGYNRAANIVEQMEKDGIVSAPNHAGKREVLG